jgi:ribosomal protein S18 acetylase RimI-like enzyme
MQRIPLWMLRGDLDDLPRFVCPPDVRLRTFVPGDEANWARVETLAGEFPDSAAALERFEHDYGAHRAELAHRCFLLEDRSGTVVGTATAWYGDFAGMLRGQVAWVGIAPAYQGRKLAKPLLSAVLQRLADDHTSAFLGTQTTSFQAINMYLDFGFVPFPRRATCAEGWALMERVLKRPIF